MGATSIEWTDFSLNPIRARLGKRVGHHCEKISPGCARCYSSRLQPRFGLPQFQDQRGEQAVDSFLDPKVLESVLRRKKPAKFFWCDMTDMFGDWVPDEWIAACFGVMAATPQHTHQVLTKRPERAAAWFRWVVSQAGYVGARSVVSHAVHRLDLQTPWSHDMTWPLPNVWLGCSVENQEYAEKRIPVLLYEIPAAVRFLSVEPQIGPVDLSRPLLVCANWRSEDSVKGGGPPTDAAKLWWTPQALRGVGQRTVDWVIVGGESGPGARPFDIAWARSIVAQCKAAGVPVFVKQLGARPLGKCARCKGDGIDPVRVDHDPEWCSECGGSSESLDPAPIDLRSRKGGDMAEWPIDLRVREFPCR